MLLMQLFNSGFFFKNLCYIFTDLANPVIRSKSLIYSKMASVAVLLLIYLLLITD